MPLASALKRGSIGKFLDLYGEWRSWMGRLTTHVLDTVRGRPGAGLLIDLFALDDGRRLIASFVTNDDGRVDQPLLEGKAFAAGRYELLFHAGDYFKAAGIAAGTPPFLDEIPVRFQVASPEAHYHVPLLLSPWSYSTYRGS
jgi:5-hydroxyisourate hydrolase